MAPIGSISVSRQGISDAQPACRARRRRQRRNVDVSLDDSHCGRRLVPAEEADVPTSARKIGHVTERRYQELVARALELMETITSCQFAIGDMAVQIEPVHQAGDSPSGVYEALRQFADDIAVEFETLLDWRYVANAWPKPRRVKGIPFGVYKQLAPMQPEERRFAVIKSDPPKDPRTGQRRWTLDTAARLVHHVPAHPVTVDEKVNKIHDLARDDQVAATAVSDMLRRPDVAHRVMGDATSRHMLYRAHRDRVEQVQEVARDRTKSIRSTAWMQDRQRGH